MRALLDVAPPITAVFCLSDAMALGASGVLRERGVEVPRRMSLIGFDDISLAAELTPALSTVHVPLKEMGAAAMRMILDPGSDRPRTERFAAQLRLRETTGPAS
jgi:LacI family transcriptional regulator